MEEGLEMAGIPELKITRHFGSPPEVTICDLEEARDFLRGCLPGADSARLLVAVEGQQVRSFEELVALVSQDCYREKEYIEIGIYPVVGGG